MSMVHLVVRLDPGLLGGGRGTSLPLDRCITDQAVLKFLDGKTVFGVETITLRKEKSSSLVIRSDEPGTILVRFNLGHERKQYLGEGSFLFTTNDDPGLHYHGWEWLGGRVVSVL